MKISMIKIKVNIGVLKSITFYKNRINWLVFMVFDKYNYNNLRSNTVDEINK